MGQPKYYSLWGKAIASDGSEHYVTVVGKCSQEKETITVPTETSVTDDKGREHNATLLVNVKRRYRKLTLARAICHPSDEFNFEKGVEMCKKRIEQGIIIGEQESENITMLNDDQCEILVFCEVNHIIKNIDKYISEN